MIVPEKVPRGSKALKPPSNSLWFGAGAPEVAEAGAADTLEKVLSPSLAFWGGADNLGATDFDASPFLQPKGHKTNLT